LLFVGVVVVVVCVVVVVVAVFVFVFVFVGVAFGVGVVVVIGAGLFCLFVLFGFVCVAGVIVGFIMAFCRSITHLFIEVPPPLCIVWSRAR